MITLECPRCGQGVEVGSSPRGPSFRCPVCGFVFPFPDSDGESTAPPVLPELPIPGPAATPLPAPAPGETLSHGDVPTRVSVPPGAVSFLAPARQPGELGWLGSYRILKLLGCGGMGIVFHAIDTHLERPVALKVMNPDAARDPAARQRFLREARLTARLKSDHIVIIHQVGQIDDLPFLAMEMLQGETLAAWLLRKQRPTPAQVLALAFQVCHGLEVAHSAGLIHRDIKPANIWLEARRGEPGSSGTGGRAKILDFGLARLTRDSVQLTQVGMVLGTPAYMAPEQAEGEAVDARCDLFSLGCVLYEFATGEQPFPGPTTFAILTAKAVRDPAPLSQVNPAIPAELSSLVMRLLAKKPADRPASAAAVIEELEAIAAAYPDLQSPSRSGSGARPKSAPALTLPAIPVVTATLDRGGPHHRRTQVMLAGLAGVLVALFLAAWLGPWRGGAQGPAAPRSLAQGVSEDRVLLGFSGPFTGSASELGRSMHVGMQTYFKYVNDEGGIAGRKVELVALDDGYEPDRALANMRELDEQYKVFAFVGNVGTPTAEKALPYALDRQMLFFGAFTGAGLLRKEPPDRYVFNYRASYAEETEAAVRYLLDIRKVRPEQIAVFAQEDGYGDSGFRGVERALRKHERLKEQILRVGYPRNTLQVEAAAQEVIRHKEVRAVIMVPTYRPAARFIRLVKDGAGREVIFTSTSFVDSTALAEELRQSGPEYAEGVIVTQTVPQVDSRATAILTYRELLRKYHPSESPSSVSLEGYISAALLAEGLRRAGDHLTTETLIDALEGIRDLDLGIGVRLSFGPSEHQASHKVWGIVLDRNGRYEAVDLE